MRADSIVLAPEGNSVILANPVDKTLYYYQEGMAAPMGNFQNYRREPLAVLVVDRSLRETAPGVYSTTVKLPASGHYDVAFLTDSPRISHCFDAVADPNPVLKEEKQVALRIEHLSRDVQLQPGQDFRTPFQTNRDQNEQSERRFEGCTRADVPCFRCTGNDATLRSHSGTDCMKSISMCRRPVFT